VRRRRDEVDERAKPTCRFTEYRHIVRVAAERPDVPAYPLQGGLLVLDAVIARYVIGRLAAQGRMGHESECPEPIVDGHHDHAGLHKLACVILVAFADHERTAVDPHHHRVRLIVVVVVMVRVAVMVTVIAVIAVAVWGKHVEEQAVFGRRGIAVRPGSLWTVVAESSRILRGGRGR